MFIYQAAIFDKGEQLGDPEKDVGLFISLGAAKEVALDEKDFPEQEPLVYALELQGLIFQCIGVWWVDRSGPAPEWKYREED